MNLRGVRFAKKLGNDFFKFYDELTESQKKFKNFKEKNLISVLETLDVEDSEEGVSRFNKEIRAFWVSTFYFKASYYVNSGICNGIAKEKVDSTQSKSIAQKFEIDNSIEDVLTIVTSLSHYEILSEYYFSKHLETLGKSGFDSLQSYLIENGIDEVSNQVLKVFLGSEATVPLQASIILHYCKLVEQAWEYSKKNSLVPIRDEDLLKYKNVLTQVFMRRGVETTEEVSEDITDFIRASFNPYTE